MGPGAGLPDFESCFCHIPTVCHVRRYFSSQDLNFVICKLLGQRFRKQKLMAILQPWGKSLSKRKQESRAQPWRERDVGQIHDS